MGGEQGEEGLSRKEKRLVDIDNSVVIAGARGGIRVLNGKGKKIFRDKNGRKEERKRIK